MFQRTVGPSALPGRIQLASAALLAALSGGADAADWRMVIATADVVIMVEAKTFRRDGQQINFRSTAFQPKPDADGSIGNVGELTFDCAGRRMKSEQMLDIRVGGSTVPTTGDKPGFQAIPKGSVIELFLDRMCRIKQGGHNAMGGVMVFVPPETAAMSVFGLLKLGLDNEQASKLASSQYFDEESLKQWFDDAAVPQAKRSAVRQALAVQTANIPVPPPPIVPLKSAVATGRVGKYSYSAPEIGAGLWLRADGTFRYGLTVGSLDETAAGRWTAKGNRVQLVNEPRPKAPEIAAGPGALVPGAPLSVALRTAAGRAVQGVDFVVEFDTGPPRESYTQQTPWVLPADTARQPRAITFAWPSYGLRPTRFALDAKTSNALTFVLSPNDFGVVDLTGLLVEADQEALTLHRSDGDTMRFTKTSR